MFMFTGFRIMPLYPKISIEKCFYSPYVSCYTDGTHATLLYFTVLVENVNNQICSTGNDYLENDKILAIKLAMSLQPTAVYSAHTHTNPRNSAQKVMQA